MKDLIELGSQTAKTGFKNEDDIIKKFNNWQKDKEAQKWLKIMGYVLDEIEYVKAIKLSGYKTDVQVQVTIKLKQTIDVENIQVKLVSNLKSGFNQIDKRRVDKYAKMWNIPSDVVKLLKYYTGEIPPYTKNTSDKRRMYINEFKQKEQTKILKFFRKNKILIVNDILKGRGKFAAEWMLVALKSSKNAKWILRPMNYVINFYGNEDVIITKKGCLRIGKITVQRKGGDGGRKTARMLQFKINPLLLFED